MSARARLPSGVLATDVSQAIGPAARAAALGAVVLCALWGCGVGEQREPPRRPQRSGSLVVPPDAVPGPEPEEEDAAVLPTSPDAASAERAAERSPERDPERAPAGTVRVRLRAPEHVRWLEGTAALGGGNLSVPLKRSTTSLTAIDGKRGVRSRVPVVDGVADYGALPKGRIQIRATPYAEIFLGTEARGSTPFHDVEVVVGEYAVTLKNKGRSEKRTVTVKEGAVARVDVRFD